MFNSFQSQTIDAAKVGQCKATLKYYLSDRFSGGEDESIAEIYAQFLIDVATQFRQCAVANIKATPTTADESYQVDLWNWILAHVGQPIGGNDLIIWAIALEMTAAELSH